MGYRSYDRHAADPLELGDAVPEPVELPAYVVEDHAFYPGSVRLGDEFYRTQGVCEGPAPFHVDDEDDAGIRYDGGAHVGYVLVVDVDLRRGSGAFHDDVVVPLLEELHVLLHDPPAGSRDEFVVVRFHVVIRVGLPADDDLGHGVLLRLQEDRVHVAVRGLEAGGLGLDGLGHGYLRPHAGGLGVQAHVLALERGDQMPFPLQDPAYSRDGDGFPRVGGGSDHHHGLPLAVEPLLHIREDVLEPGVLGRNDAEASDLLHDVSADLGPVDEQAVRAGPDIAVLPLQIASEVLVHAGIERAVAECAVLPLEMTWIVFAREVAADPAPPEFLIDLLLDAIHDNGRSSRSMII